MKEIVLTGKKLLLKKRELTKIKTDNDGWSIYFLDKNFEKWVEEYPNSENHGGGLSQLRLLEKFPWE